MHIINRGFETFGISQGDSDDDAPWGVSIQVDGFGRYSDTEHDPTIPQRMTNKLINSRLGAYYFQLILVLHYGHG